MNRTHFRFAPQALVGLTLVLGLSACGGDSDPAPPSTRQLSVAPTPTGLGSPLLAEDGSPMPNVPGTAPADAGERTRAGLYASAEQARQLEQAMRGRVIAIDAECCGADGVELSIGITHGLQVAQDLPDGVPILVRGQDQRQVAAVANRLQDLGHDKVWLVTR